MTFIPINQNIVIEPLDDNGFVQEMQAKKEERGRVVTIFSSEELFQPPFKVGDIVSFDSWLIAKTPTGEVDEHGQDKYRWLVELKDIRGYEPSLSE